MEKLTLRQQKALEYIWTHTESKGYSPSLRELCEHMGYKAVGSAQDVIASLRRKGYLKLAAKQKARTLIVTDQAKLRFSHYAETVRDSSSQRFCIKGTLSIPQLGSVPAGNPLEAIEESSGTLDISPSLLPRAANDPNRLFALQASGLSMINAGIHDGDWLVVKSRKDAEPGSIVVAMSSGEATVKRLMYTAEKGWWLQPENPDFQPTYASQTPFEIVGQVVALQRTIH